MSRRFELEHALDVGATVGVLAKGRHDPCFRRAGDGIWRATRTPWGPATVHIDDRATERHRPGGVVTVEAWGPGRDWALSHAEDLLGLHDTNEDFCPRHPLVRETLRRHRGVRLCRSLALTEMLVPVILEQKVQSIAAHRSWRGLVRAYGERAPGPAELWLPPEPARLASLGYDAYHRFDIERRRADAIRRVCSRAPQIDRLVTLPGPEIQRRLQTLPGIGPWTTSTAVQAAVGDPDAVVVGDYHLPHTVSWALAGEARGTDERMLDLLAPFAGHRGRVQRMLRYAGGGPPRRGPRLSVMSFRDR